MVLSIKNVVNKYCKLTLVLDIVLGYYSHA